MLPYTMVVASIPIQLQQLYRQLHVTAWVLLSSLAHYGVSAGQTFKASKDSGSMHIIDDLTKSRSRDAL
jgi:hypothetical protein